MHERPKYAQHKDEPYVQGYSEPFIWAHRGGSMEAPENTLQSFLHSVQHGVDIIECDVRITKDGEIIVAHDADF